MNVRTCRLAASGVAVRVALGDPFICPECGGSLAPPALDTIRPRGRAALLVAVFACVAIGAGATVLVRGGILDRRAPPPEPPPVLVALAPAVLTAPPARVTEDALADIQPATFEAEAKATPSRPSRKVRRLAALQAAATPAGPGRHHANVHVSLSIPLVAGGQPDYPEQYEEDGRSGNVTVACALLPDGSPRQCRTTRMDGGRIFDVSVHSWLELKDVRFQRSSRRRRSPVRNVTLTVKFIGDGPLQQD
jgi:hypothetical protein